MLGYGEVIHFYEVEIHNRKAMVLKFTFPLVFLKLIKALNFVAAKP